MEVAAVGESLPRAGWLLVAGRPVLLRVPGLERVRQERQGCYS